MCEEFGSKTFMFFDSFDNIPARGAYVRNKVNGLMSTVKKHIKTLVSHFKRKVFQFKVT